MRLRRAWLVGIGLAVAAPAWAVGPRVERQPASEESEVPPAKIQAAMDQVNEARLTRYITYWKAVEERSGKAVQREANKPFNQQANLSVIFRAIRADEARKSGLTQTEISALDLATDTYDAYINPPRRFAPVCATEMSEKEQERLFASVAAAEAQKHAQFAKDYGTELEKLFAAHEADLHKAKQARSSYPIL